MRNGWHPLAQKSAVTSLKDVRESTPSAWRKNTAADAVARNETTPIHPSFPQRRRSPRGRPVRRPPRSPAQLQLESGWCGSTAAPSLPTTSLFFLSASVFLFLRRRQGQLHCPLLIERRALRRRRTSDKGLRTQG
ncbi:unnamed protein product [Urochloa humidicola]